MTLLPIGTHVVRGPTWCWGDQDRSGPGTIVYYQDPRWFKEYTVAIDWPDGSANVYRCTDVYKDVVPVKKSTFEELM